MRKGLWLLLREIKVCYLFNVTNQIYTVYCASRISYKNGLFLFMCQLLYRQQKCARGRKCLSTDGVTALLKNRSTEAEWESADKAATLLSQSNTFLVRYV